MYPLSPTGKANLSHKKTQPEMAELVAWHIFPDRLGPHRDPASDPCSDIGRGWHGVNGLLLRHRFRPSVTYLLEQLEHSVHWLFDLLEIRLVELLVVEVIEVEHAVGELLVLVHSKRSLQLGENVLGLDEIVADRLVSQLDVVIDREPILRPFHGRQCAIVEH